MQVVQEHELDVVETQIRDGKEAEAVRNNPVMQKILASVREDSVAEWQRAKTVEQREAAWALNQAIDRVDAAFAKFIGNGDMAAKRLDASNRRTKGTR